MSLFGRFRDPPPQVQPEHLPQQTNTRLSTTDLVEELVAVTGLAKKDVKNVVSVLFSPSPTTGLLAAHMDRRDIVTITGFGRFDVRQRPSTKKRLPSGQVTVIGARDYPRFRASDTLKTMVRSPGAEIDPLL